jgi:putative transposase
MFHLLHDNVYSIIILDMDKQLKAYRFRIYPNAAQRQQLAVEFGNARFVWNRCLDLRTKDYEAYKTAIAAGDAGAVKPSWNYVSLSRMVTEWKHGDFSWLADSAAACLTQALIDQDKAFQHFYRRAKNGEKPGYPRFKSRHHRQSIRYTLDQHHIGSSYIAGEFLKLPKLGAVKVRWSQVPAGTPKMATVSRTPDGRYFVSFSCEVEIESLPMTGKTVGVDLGVKDVAVTWDGDQAMKSGNPRHMKRRLKHLKRQQRRLSLMKKGSNRRAKQRLKVAKIHARIAVMRSDFLHKTTTAIVNGADVIAIEDLNVKWMVKNHCLAGAIADVGMSEFRRQIEYKAAWYGRTVVVVDRWFPSSKTCSECGSYRKKMPLSVRDWTCPDCGTRHDRDVNAAKNLRNIALGNRVTARGGSKNLLGLPDTPDEARTEEFTEAACLERAA